MIVAIYYIAGGAAFGALLGAGIAKRRGGRLADLLHYAAVLAIAFALVGLFVSVIIGRSLAG
jgi:Na+/H+ antiporter NhaC